MNRVNERRIVLNVNDLTYLINSVSNEKKNIYKTISIGTNSSHINFLKRSEFQYDVETLSASEKLFKIYSKTNKLIDSFVFPFYPNTTQFASELTKDKSKLESHFHKNGFRTTHSNVYNFDESRKAKSDFISLNSTNGAVIKPLNSSLGKGVFVNVPVHRFDECWQYSKDDLSISEKRNEKDLKFIVQNYIPGFEARATILQGTLVSIIARIPPYIVGDGINTIKELIIFKNKERGKCKYLSKHPIKVTNKVTEFLESNNQSIDYIPQKGEYILLSSVSNIVGGGEIINITDKVSENIKDFALDVLASIPGIYSGGLDIILDSYDDKDPHILEVNTYPVISLTKYPTYGLPSNPSKILFESLISQYQIGQAKESQYDIHKSDIYIKNFIAFTKRRLKFLS